MQPLRVGIVGARRASQGIGAFVAGHFAALGAQVSAIVGTRRETVDAAAGELARQFSLAVRGYTSVKEMLDRESLDALAICSPQECHREHLMLALDRRLHVLCEKPLVFTSGRDNAADAEPIASAFAANGRLLMVNEQWPYTLDAFDRCLPQARREPLRRFDMVLAPAVDGPAMIPNAMPHVLSLLAACVPRGETLENIGFDYPGDGRLDIVFRYRHVAGHIDVRTRLLVTPRQPRPAGYAINGRGVRRIVRMADYALFLEPVAGELISALDPARTPSDGRPREIPQSAQTGAPGQLAVGSTALEDPLRLLVAAFISRTRNVQTPAPHDPMVVNNVRMLDQIARACSEAGVFGANVAGRAAVDAGRRVA